MMSHISVANQVKEPDPTPFVGPVRIDAGPEGQPTSDPEFFIKRTFETDPEKGFELLFKRYYSPLCSHAVRFVYAQDVAQDIVADVLSQFWQQKRHMSVTTSYRAYLFTMVRHAAFDHLKAEFGREVPNHELPETDPANQLPTPQQLLQYNELAIKIDEIIRSVSPQSRQVFVMSRFEGKKNPVIAEELHISIKTVEGHITKMLALLRRILRQDGLLVGLWLVSWSVATAMNQLSGFLTLTYLLAL